MFITPNVLSVWRGNDIMNDLVYGKCSESFLGCLRTLYNLDISGTSTSG